MLEQKICRSPGILLTIFTLLSNTVMLVDVYKEKRLKKRLHIMFAAIGLVNLVYVLSLILKMSLKALVPLRSLYVAVGVTSITLGSSLIQIGLTNALAYDRYQAVTNAVVYRSVEQLRLLKRRIAVGSAICLVISTAVALPTETFNAARILHAFLGIFRVSSCAALCVIYFLVYKRIRINNARVRASSRSNPSCSSAATRQQFERHVLKMCVGLTSSFAILNLPMAITFCLIEIEMTATQ